MKKQKMTIKDLPILGNAQIPVRIMHYSHKKDNKRFFQSGFAYFGVADDQADVTGPNGEDLGSMGARMGGHYQVIQNREEDRVTVIIDVEDLWDSVSCLLKETGVEVKLEGIEKIYKKYWAKKEKLDEIEAMQKDAEMERMLEEEKASRKEPEPASEEIRKIDDVEIIDDAGWDLNKEIEGYDYHFDEDYKFDRNLGLGVRIKKSDGIIYKSVMREKVPTVTLDISTWRGMGCGAIHYYGDLKISLPHFESESRENYFSSAWEIPLFKNDTIKMTHVLEQWEIDRYPDNYRDNRPGQYIRGFYTPEGAKRAAKEFFNKHFGQDWELVIEENY